jgi:isopenicillin N synthase-like dioxygenase
MPPVQHLSASQTSVPIVDLGAADAAARIDAACRRTGFVALGNHGVPSELRERVLEAARELFALPVEAKRQIALALGGTAWRGWFPLGDELTSGVPDLKEGFYVGRELPPSPLPLHGPNLWPTEHVPDLAPAVTAWMDAMEALGQRVLAAMADGLGLPADWFARELTADPTVLFRIFRYPPHPEGDGEHWGVGEHTDYGLVTLLAHDGTPGLEVRGPDGWQAVDPDPELIICNLGDMLDRLTGGRYRSTPHRVRNHAGHDRISLPFFLDPSWSSVIEPLPLDDGWVPPAERVARWDQADLTEFHGVYGDWLLAKVRRVFPQLADAVLD